MRTARKQGESNIYHVVGRGVGQQLIFEDDDDRGRFLDYSESSFGDVATTDDASSLDATGTENADAGSILAYCLMDNHFHILARMPMPQLSCAMRNLLGSYALYFNRRHGRTGHLFQDRFKSEPVDTDDYLLAVVRYIHLNPKKAGIAAGADYPWSSYGCYLGASDRCDTRLVLDLLGGVEEFREFHEASCDERCLDVTDRRARIGDADAVDLARRELGDNPAQGIALLTKGERNAVVRTFKDAGMTTKQIQRITGLGRGVIEKA